MRESGARLRALLDEEGLFAEPARLLADRSGSGLPQQAERAALASQASERVGRQRRILQEDARQWLP